ncbi:MAG: hypothetical protein ACYDBS_12150, partial [Acidimicrobiales bacterium]
FSPEASGSCSAPDVVSGNYCALPYVLASLTYDSSTGDYVFVTHPATTYTFDSTGQLISESNANGDTLTLAYGTPSPGSGSCPSTATACEEVTSASGRSLVIATNSAGQVTSVTDPLGRSWSYAYTSSGDLSSATDPLGRVTSYTYDTTNTNAKLRHDLVTLTAPNGQPGGPNAGASLVNVYDSSGRVISQTDPAGLVTSFDYSAMNESTGNGDVVVTNPKGNKTEYVYTGNVLTIRIDGYGSSSSTTWTYKPDSSTLLVDSVTDPNGNATYYSYDAAGNVISKTDAIGDRWTYSYNAFDEQTCATEPLSTSTCQQLSPPGSVPDPVSAITPPSSIPPAYVTFTEYDVNGNELWRTAGAYPPGTTSTSTAITSYFLHNGESVTLGGTTDSCAASAPSPSLQCATVDARQMVTQLSYDSSGDLALVTNPDGDTTSFAYDTNGEMYCSISPKVNAKGGVSCPPYGSGYVMGTTSNVFDAGGELTSTTNPVGDTTSYAYDANGNRTLVTDPSGNKVQTTYDADNRRVTVTTGYGTSASS